jgi:hypothetical protein
MAVKPATIARCRAAYQVLLVMLDRVPSQREVAKCAPATTTTVSAVWEEIIADPADLYQPRQVPATRKCLSCERPFSSHSAGHRICQRCRGLDVWQSCVAEYSTSLQF